LAVLFALGVCMGSAANLAIYRLAWFPRAISPWSRPDPAAPPRRPWDRIPIFGWLGLRRESRLHGAGFWIRPMAIETLAGVGLAALYAWEVVAAGLLPRGLPSPLPPDLFAILHLEFAAHTVLIALMLAASMIDVDEKIIPDEITISGTLIGLVVAAAWPWSLLPNVTPMDSGRWGVDFLHLAAPNPWPDGLNGWPHIQALAWGLIAWWWWCIALLPRTWYPRHGWRRAVQLSLARMARQHTTYRILRMALIGSVVIAILWFQGGAGWRGLLSALTGMLISGGMIWLVRIIGTAALKREAMGFGDVTLMAMIGTFLGWQPCLIVFFLAPVAGLVVGVLRLILWRDKEIPYGPFLCLATLFLIVGWRAVWDRTEAVFALGGGVLLLMLGCLALMGLMLGAWRLIAGALRP
jgi:prepilin signal peptidase PulO-like enzyme (type II secretory pathway)